MSITDMGNHSDYERLHFRRLVLWALEDIRSKRRETMLENLMDTAVNDPKLMGNFGAKIANAIRSDRPRFARDCALYMAISVANRETCPDRDAITADDLAKVANMIIAEIGGKQDGR